ncbi:ABC transporter fmpD [Lasiodiplodia hormozganensis]|uniref:ABC transporter fmpD n=1 Tax=Lasiodiplodia hormozganensis TaxID=869390 RepID=A0AA40BVY9_9PEZI|nr:ABC transporter fmpD [Lasiodiplodia hormozganensis]
MPDPSHAEEGNAANAANAVIATTAANAEQEEEKPKQIQRFTQYFQLLIYAQPTKLDIFLLVTGFICAIASGIPFPLLGIIFGQLIDDLNSATCSSDSSQDAGYQSSVDGKILYVVYLAIAQFGFMYIHLSCWSLGGARLAQRLREQYLKALLRQEPSFFDKLPGGEVSSRLNGDVQSIRNGTSEKVGICISSASFFVTAYVVAFVKHAALAGILVSLVPAYMLMSWVGNYFIERYAGRMSDHLASAAALASEGLSNVLVVHAFSANARLEERFATDLLRSQREGVKKAVASGVQAGLMYFIAYAANALAFWEGSRIIADAVGKDSNVGVGSIFTVIFILVDATLVLSQVAPYLQTFGAASAAFAKLRRDMDQASRIDGTSDEGEAVPVDGVAGQIELRDVSFAYPSRPDATVLRAVSLSMEAGRHTAIVGLSGSGKSTIAGLVSRLYDPTGGAVLLDGKDLRTLNARQLRAHISLVQQEATLLDRSILENVAHGLVNSPDPAHDRLRQALLGPELAQIAEAVRERGEDPLKAAEKLSPEMVLVVELVQRAAEQADAATFIGNLKGGLGTRVGPGGRMLSGGQKQRVALARALVKNPKILILDEATASLDSRSEQAILGAIEKVSEGRTMISIAHRLSTIKKADKIIVLRDGVVLEEGNHAELLAKEGAYADLVRLQNSSGDEKAKASSAAPSLNETFEGTSIEKAPTSENQTPIGKLTEKKAEASTEEVVDEKAEESSGSPSDRSLGNIIAETCRMARPHLLIVLLALLGATIVGGAFSAEAVIFGNTVQSLNPCKSEESIRWHGRFFGLLFFILAVIEFFANIISWSGFGYVAEKIMYRVRVLSFRALFEQDLQWHQSEGRTPASLLSVITNDGNLLGGLSGSIIGTMFSIVVNLIAAIVLTHVVAWKIALVCLAIVPLLLGVGIQQLRVLAKFEERHENAYAESVGIGVEAANSIKAIASLSLEHETLAAYRRSLAGPREETTLVSLHASLWLAAAYFIGNLGYALAYWWGSKNIISGYYGQAQFLIVVFSLLVSAQLWSQMFALAPEVSSARAAIARILNVIELNPDQRLSGSGRIAPPPPGDTVSAENEKDVEASAASSPVSTERSGGIGIEFRDVEFAYPARPNARVLHGLSLSVRPGQFAAFVGPSGAGKSTIIALVERMYVAAAGSVLVDGRDVARQTTDASFRDDIALVPQESVLFDGSVRFNLGLGARPGHAATDAEIEEACRLANIHDVIAALPDGYDTVVGPNGGRLSGGQKQRLAIARALVRRPRLLILDESTSALDAESEKLLQDGLAKAVAQRGITVLAIAHRLHTIRKADVIFLIEQGRCVDRGTHDELFERSESYRTNVLHQTSAE